MAPMSEIYGRRPVSIGCLFVFTVLIIPCALSKSVEALIIVRFIGAFFGSVMISSAPGMVADLVQDDKRALAMSIWSIGPVNGPGSLFPARWTMQGRADSNNSAGPDHWRFRDAVSGLAVDGLDCPHAVRSCAGPLVHHEGDI
jgi:MFS family permease